ncbi:MAG: enoyl-CoA hydratase/isomerase family protein [Propionibacteriaceae bacterium]|nr:enoyl-CoA hydratase/isomerase family protein [Propionibacteriaceae bacterium]
MPDLMMSIEENTGQIRLNRPQALNALTGAMIDGLFEQLTDWVDSPAVERVVISGQGRAFCAGADVRELRNIVLAGTADPVDFLCREYRLDQLIASYPKPLQMRLHGIVMGGGCGLSLHSQDRQITADAALGMPETIIGLWPDVGMLYELSRLPGEVGAYLALTGLTVSGAEAYQLGLVDVLADDRDESGRPAGQLVQPSVPDRLDWCATTLAGDDIVAMVEALEGSGDPICRASAAAIRQRSPLSVATSLAALRRAKAMTLKEVFAQDLQLGAFFLGQPDFVEGVRAQLIDRDHQPHWSYSALEELTPANIAAAFGD